MRGSLAVVACLLAVACRSSHPGHAPAKAGKDAGPPIVERRSVDLSVIHLPQPEVKLPRQEAFTLLAPGAAPRAELRYALAPGTASYLVKTALVSRRQLDGTWAAPSKLPAIENGFSITVTAPGQPLALQPLAGTAAKASLEADQYLATWRRLLAGRQLSVALDARGQLGPITFVDDPSGGHSREAKDEVVERLLGTLVPLPAEPVGVGAKWRVITVLRQRPALVKQTAVYTLEAIRGGRWTIGVETRRVGEEQVVEDPALPKGASADLVALVRTYRGKLEVSPQHPLPTGGTLKVSSTVHVRITLPGPAFQEQILQDDGTVSLSVRAAR